MAARTQKAYDVFKFDKYIMTGTRPMIQKRLDMTNGSFQHIAYTKKSKTWRITECGKAHQIYGLYDGDTFMMNGTIEQIAAFTNRKEEQIAWLRHDSAQARNLTLSLVELDEEIEIERTVEKPKAEGDIMRVKRTHGAKFAPVPTNTQQPEEIKVLKNVPVQPVEWKPSEYTRMLFDHTFRKWA